VIRLATFYLRDLYSEYLDAGKLMVDFLLLPSQGGVCLAFADEVLCWLYGTVRESEFFLSVTPNLSFLIVLFGSSFFMLLLRHHSDFLDSCLQMKIMSCSLFILTNVWSFSGPNRVQTRSPIMLSNSKSSSKIFFSHPLPIYITCHLHSSDSATLMATDVM